MDEGSAGPSPTTVSLAGLLLENNRQRLYTEPIQWTSTHLTVLDCTFVTRDNNEPMTDRDEQSDRDKTKVQDGQRAVRVLRSDRISKELMKFAIEELISSFFLNPKDHFLSTDPSLTLYYNYTTKAYVQVKSSFNTPFMSLAYLDLDSLHEWRYYFVDKRYGRALRRNSDHDNAPVLGIIRGKLRLLERENPDHDPYILGVLLALAQKRQMGGCRNRSDWREASANRNRQRPVDGVERGASSPSEESFKVGVIATRYSDADFLRLYTCRVPATFLSRFDRPKEKFEAVPLEIDVSVIQVSPSWIAVEQLGAILQSP